MNDVTVRIEVPFQYRHGESERIVDPEDLATAAPLLELHGAQLQRIDVHTRGELQISFSAKRAITVRPSPHHESFPLHIGPGYMFIGDIGGGIGTYQPPGRTTP